MMSPLHFALPLYIAYSHRRKVSIEIYSAVMLKGAMIVGVADSRGTIYNPQGLDIEALIELKKAGKGVVDYPAGKKLDRDAVIANRSHAVVW